MKSTSQISLFPRFRIRRGKKIAFGPGKSDLLRLVAETGSIGEAARRMDMSYMRAWSLIRMMNECFKAPVIEAMRGGHKRGGAEVTEAGHRLLELYQRMEKTSLKATANSWKQLRRLLRD